MLEVLTGFLQEEARLSMAKSFGSGASPAA
jgi:hypothetical protein